MAPTISNEDIFNIAKVDNIEGGSVSFSKDFITGNLVWYGHILFRKNNTNANQHFGPCESEDIIRNQMRAFMNGLNVIHEEPIHSLKIEDFKG